MSSSPGSEEHIDYVVVHRALGQPRYTFRYRFIQLTAFEAGITAALTIALWWIIDSLSLGSRTVFGIISWELMPFMLLIILPAFFSFIHYQRPDLKILEIISGAFVPTQFKDLPDKSWKPSTRRRHNR